MRSRKGVHFLYSSPCLVCVYVCCFLKNFPEDLSGFGFPRFRWPFVFRRGCLYTHVTGPARVPWARLSRAHGVSRVRYRNCSCRGQRPDPAAPTPRTGFSLTSGSLSVVLAPAAVCAQLRVAASACGSQTLTRTWTALSPGRGEASLGTSAHVQRRAISLRGLCGVTCPFPSRSPWFSPKGEERNRCWGGDSQMLNDKKKTLKRPALGLSLCL